MATASESQPLLSTNSAACAGSVRQTLPTMSSSTPPSWPSSASTTIPLAWARSTTRRVISMFFVELLVRGVDHHRAIEAAVDAVVADFFGAVIEVDGEDHLGKDLVGRADHRFEEPLVAVAAGAAGNLEDERGARGRVDRVLVRLRLAQIAAEQADGLFEVVDVVGPDGVLAVGVLKKLFGGNDHGTCLAPARTPYRYW